MPHGDPSFVEYLEYAQQSSYKISICAHNYDWIKECAMYIEQSIIEPYNRMK